MRVRPLPVLVLIVGLLAACNLAPEPDDEPLATATGLASGRPQVVISAPQDGAEVVLNEEVLIRATATDAVGVQRVQLLADGQIVRTVSSESPAGDRSFDVLLGYTPRQEGEARLQVIAYRGAVASEPASLRLVVREDAREVTATPLPSNNVPQIDPNDPTCRALVNVGLNLRTGPGTNYNVITVLAAGRVVPIIGRVGSNEWWQVRANTTIGWVSAAYTTVYGNCAGIPVVQPPATATSPATNTAAPTLTPVPTLTQPPSNTPPPSPPDLVIANISGPTTLEMESGQQEVEGTYAITITNTGGPTSGQFNNVIIRSPGNIEIPLGVVASLGANESIILTVEITFGAAGDYTLQARADANANIAELSEVNNNAFYSVTVND